MAYLYATLANLKLHVDVRLLTQLTNDVDTVDPSDSSQIDESVLQAMENEAAYTVDNFLRHVYALPLSPTANSAGIVTLTPEIIRMVAKLTLANLWERRGNIPESVKEMKGRVYGRLKRLGKPAAEEVRGQRETTTGAQPIRSSKGKAATMFQRSGYFDGISTDSRGSRPLAADEEG